MWEDYKREFKYHYKEKELTKSVVKELQNKAQSDEEPVKLLWRVSQSNTHTVSKETGIDNRKLKKTIKPIINYIKRKMNE